MLVHSESLLDRPLLQELTLYRFWMSYRQFFVWETSGVPVIAQAMKEKQAGTFPSTPSSVRPKAWLVASHIEIHCCYTLKDHCVFSYWSSFPLLLHRLASDVLERQTDLSVRILPGLANFRLNHNSSQHLGGFSGVVCLKAGREYMEKLPETVFLRRMLTGYRNSYPDTGSLMQLSFWMIWGWWLKNSYGLWV